MKKTVINIFKGLTPQYYFRQLFFSILIFGIIILFMGNAGIELDEKAYKGLVLGTINTLLYPYARFAYESIVNFFTGDNEFYLNAVWMLMVKFLTMVLCWGFAIFIAPLGLILIYLYQRKEKKEEKE